MKSKPFLIALVGVALVTPAQAETLNNWYISGAVGLTKTNDADFKDTGLTGDFEIDNTINFAVAVGRQIKEHVRGELELSHRKADLDTLNVNGVGSASIGGDVTTTAALINGYYDFMPDNKFSPYLSGGIGLARHDGEASGGGVTVSDDDTVFAYQVGAGASYDIDNRTALFGGYRYFGSSDPEFDTLEAEYDAHEVRVGVRYSF